MCIRDSFAQNDPQVQAMVADMNQLVQAINLEPENVITACFSRLEPKAITKINKFVGGKNSDYVFSGISKVFFETHLANLARKTEDMNIAVQMLTKITHMMYIGRYFDETSGKLMHAKCIEDLSTLLVAKGAAAAQVNPGV